MDYITTAYSKKTTADEAVEEIKAEFSNITAKLIIYFASSNFDQNKLNINMKNAFGDSLLMGCSTAGEIVSGKMLKNSVVAMAFTSDAIDDIAIEVLENINETNNVPETFKRFENHFGEKMSDMEFKKYIGMILCDGLSGAEERVMDKIGDLTNVMFVGGSAGDDLKFKATYVYANGKAYSNGCVLALIKPTVPFEIIKTQSFKKLDKTFTVTEADVENRTIKTLNGQPASAAYAEAVGKTIENADDCFMSNPVGLMIEGEPYVRSPQKIDGSNIVFYCNVLENMELSLLESTDMIQETKAAIESKAKEMGGISGILNFNCILRTLDLEARNQTEAYAQVFKDTPTIGFSTYGEAYIGHINQTATMIVFK